MNKKKYIIIVVIILILLIGTGIYFIRYGREKAKRIQCLSVLRSTGTTLALYRSEYNGYLPPNFSLMGERFFSDANFFLCPWGTKKPGDWKNIEEWMDYIYIPWPITKGDYAKYPLMYDRRMSNHGGKGINILLVEQVINPASPRNPKSYHRQFFWDEEAQWLQKFAKEHPECNIPLPEDLETKWTK